jgi:decaprenyl-phosphate phosphoribosyltransferase
MTTEQGTAPGRTRAPALLRAMRPKQWIKNVLVAAAPLASGQLVEPAVQRQTAIAFIAFSLAASAVYLVNDVRDVEADRSHPRKRYRPIAAGELAPATALIAATLLFAGGAAVALLASVGLLVVVVIYILLTFAYSFLLKTQPVIDLAVIAGGFILRALAGGVAADIEFSPWFLLVAGFGSLFMAAGKRFSELRSVGAGATRASLERYTEGYLRFVWAMSATVAVMTYCLWAIEVADRWPRPVLAEASIAPFVLGILRYAVDVERGAADTPEEVVLNDRLLQGFGVLWLGLFAAGVSGV